MANALDSDNWQTVVPFRYGPIAGLVSPDVKVAPARVLAGNPRRGLAKSLLWLCRLADPARLRGSRVRR